MSIAIETLIRKRQGLTRLTVIADLPYFLQPGTGLIFQARRLCHVREARESPLFANVGLVIERLHEVVAPLLERGLKVGMCNPVFERAQGDAAIFRNLCLRFTPLKDEIERHFQWVFPL